MSNTALTITSLEVLEAKPTDSCVQWFKQGTRSDFIAGGRDSYTKIATVHNYIIQNEHVSTYKSYAMSQPSLLRCPYRND